MIDKSSQIEEINRAILAHYDWKSRFIQFIKAGGTNVLGGCSGVHHDCELGYWLENIRLKMLTSLLYRKISVVHREFHNEAAWVMALAQDGQLESAIDFMAEGKIFSGISAELVYLLSRWKKEISNEIQSSTSDIE